MAKRIVQFNELVLNSFAELKEQPEIEVNKKANNLISYVGGHGSYFVASPKTYYESQQIDLDFYVWKDRFKCFDDFGNSIKDAILPFVEANLAKIGRLWAVENDRLVWTLAECVSWSNKLEENSGAYTFSASFNLPFGYWILADGGQTFLQEHSECIIQEEIELLSRPICETCTLCDCSIPLARIIDTCRCDKCNKGKPICKIPLGDLEKNFSRCGDSMKINFSCAGEDESTSTISDKVAFNKTSLILVCNVDTVIDTDEVTVEIQGKFKDLYIKINGNLNIIKGTYEGETILTKRQIWNNCERKNSINWEVPECTDSGWTLKKGRNTFEFMGFEAADIQTVCIHYQGRTM